MNSIIIDKFAKLFFNSSLNLLNSSIQRIINFLFNDIDIGLIESLMLIKDLSHPIMNHFLIPLYHFRVFKVCCYQFFNELTEHDVLFSLFKCAVLSESSIAIGEFPELLGELEPRLKVVGSRFLLFTSLHEC